MTETLQRLLEWTHDRLGAKAAMRQRFTWLLDQLIPSIGFPIIKVAGTNGKGSTSAMLSACLSEAGLKTALFTSPHLVSVTERFRINEKEIDGEELEKMAHMVETEIHQLVAKRGIAFTPSFFEVLILIALRLFSQKKVDIAIVEAGVGGHNDAVSLLPDYCALITSIGKDHQRQLGDSLGEIAGDKAGIASSGHLILNSAINPVLKKIIRQKALNREMSVQESTDYVKTMPGGGQKKVEVFLEGKKYSLAPSLQGPYQMENLNLVLTTYAYLLQKRQISSWKGIYGLEKTVWPGRFEQMGQRPRWLVDAAHNEPGLKALVEALNRETKKEERILVYGNSEEKEYPVLAGFIPQLAGTALLVDDFYKAVPAGVLAGHIAKKVEIKAMNNLDEALALVKKMYSDKLIVVTGSIFMIGKARQWIQQYGLDK